MRIDHHHYIHFVEPDLSELQEAIARIEDKVDVLLTDPALQAQVDALRAKMKASTDRLAATVAATTPAQS